MTETDIATCQNPTCSNTFKYRSNKKFCSDRCRKDHNRPKQNRHDSPTKARESLEKFDRALALGELLYQKNRRPGFYKFGKMQDSARGSDNARPPLERLGFIEGLIQQARGGNSQLRDILTQPHMRDANGYKNPEYFPFRDPNYCTIAKATAIYCRKFWRANASDVVYNRVPEPPTGEVFEDGTIDDWPENRLTHNKENPTGQPAEQPENIDTIINNFITIDTTKATRLHN